MNTNTHPVDLTAFVASGEKLYTTQRERLQAEEQAYRTERFKLQQQYEERAQRLMNEAEDALRRLDASHAETRAEGERMLKAVAAIREA